MDSPRTLARLNTIFAGIGYVVVCGIVVGGLLELGARTALHFYHHLRQHPITEAAFDTPAYSEYDWAKDCLDEQSLRLTAKNIYLPFRLWGVTEFHGRCMNNDVTDIGTVRRTLNPSQAACPNGFRTNIWIFGGSAVYGTSVPDWATLPSYLSSTLNTSMDCVRVVNLGVEGYVSNQELILLLELLKTGKRPNIVIFYDGFNDADIGTLSIGRPAPHMGFMTTKGRMEGSLASRLDFVHKLAIWQLVSELSKSTRSGPTRVSQDALDFTATRILDSYQENIQIARMLGNAYGFKVCAFWQPAILYGHKPLVPYEREFSNLSANKAYLFEELVPVYQQASQRAIKSADFVFLGDIFDTVSPPVYLDWVHLNPLGNQLAALAVAKQLHKCLNLNEE